jgi:hypothetical protein
MLGALRSSAKGNKRKKFEAPGTGLSNLELAPLVVEANLNHWTTDGHHSIFLGTPQSLLAGAATSGIINVGDLSTDVKFGARPNGRPRQIACLGSPVKGRAGAPSMLKLIGETLSNLRCCITFVAKIEFVKTQSAPHGVLVERIIQNRLKGGRSSEGGSVP